MTYFGAVDRNVRVDELCQMMKMLDQSLGHRDKFLNQEESSLLEFQDNLTSKKIGKVMLHV